MPEHDPARVNVATASGAAYWARRFRVPVERVVEAVRAVGEDPAKVAECLGVPWPDRYDGM